MTESIQIVVKLRGVVRHEGRRWVAGCPKLNVWSQGTSQQDAKRSLGEAVQLWIEDCLIRGTLDTALREVGFQPAPWDMPFTGAEQLVGIRRLTADEHLLGTDFDVSISMPAYQAAAFLQAQPSQ
jgi:predicted RNase H-like HicB family nuclease